MQPAASLLLPCCWSAAALQLLSGYDACNQAKVKIFVTDSCLHMHVCSGQAKTRTKLCGIRGRTDEERRRNFARMLVANEPKSVMLRAALGESMPMERLLWARDEVRQNEERWRDAPAQQPSVSGAPVRGAAGPSRWMVRVGLSSGTSVRR